MATTAPPVFSQDGSLFGTVELLKLASHEGTWRWPVPPSAPRLLIEIGANNRDTLDTHLPQDTFLITFEPLLTAYTELASRYSKAREQRKPLGWHHTRGIILPIAVAPAPSRLATLHLPDNEYVTGDRTRYLSTARTLRF